MSSEISKMNSQIDHLSSIVKKVENTTRDIKYDRTVGDILVSVRQLCRDAGINESEFDYYESAVLEASNALASVVYGLDELFKDKLRDLTLQRDEIEVNGINESKFEYDKKTGSMKKNDEDPDQRHGLYIDGKLVKTYATKEQADNIKKRESRFKDATVKKIAEGMMGGLNRCAPAQDVSYENILNDVHDKWKGQTVRVDELSPGTEKNVAAALNKYRSGVSPEKYYNDPHTQKKVDRRAERSMKISNKHQDQQLNELSPGKEKDVASAMHKYRSGVKPEDYYGNPHIQKKVDRRAEKAMKLTNKHSTTESYEERLEAMVGEGWKSNLAGAAMVGLGALGAGGAHAAPADNMNTEYLQGVANGSVTRPMISVDDALAALQSRKQQSSGANGYLPGESGGLPAGTNDAPEVRPRLNGGYSLEFLQKAADPNRTGRYLISVERAQELLDKAKQK